MSVNAQGKLIVTKAGISLRYWSSAIFAIILSIGVISFEPDIIADPIDQASFGLFTRLFSHSLYPENVAVNSASTVVLINQKSLTDTNEKWPPSFGFHASLLQRLIADKPAAIVLDYLLVDKRNDRSLEELEKTLLYAKEQGIPVIAARGSYTGYPEHGIIPELGKHVILSAGWRDKKNAASPFIYNIAMEHGDDHYLDSLALIAFKKYCKKYPKLPSCDHDGFNYDRNMWVFWSSRIPDYKSFFQLSDNELFKAIECEKHASNDLIGKAIDYVGGQVSSCPSQITLPAHYLIKDFDDRVKKMITNKVVFVGFNMEGIQDFVVPPTTPSPIPGVYIHAMAFDNLVAWGDDYFAIEAVFSDMRITADSIEIMTLILILIFHYAILKYVLGRTRGSTFSSALREDKEFNITNNPLCIFKYYYNRLCYLIDQKEIFGILKQVVQRLAIVIVELVILIAILFTISVSIEMYLLRIVPVNWLSILGLTGINMFLSVRMMKLN
ncbi:hypothetical protein WH96_15705 [Kiloniella spongiae]|uniref:CHASE2 domain-containing protein n=1 Tax=Kiloniella spongiae TaxID=1489064 RepID=A0A0H2MC99_9PROT|nr:CHASE2 domain-containing protein [Kiloniella spongiae]KLN59826.1 hypothetical protein WH96_15705 [Kiloniella spongiae]